MNYKYTGYNRLLVADLYHWDMEDINTQNSGQILEART